MLSSELWLSLCFWLCSFCGIMSPQLWAFLCFFVICCPRSCVFFGLLVVLFLWNHEPTVVGFLVVLVVLFFVLCCPGSLKKLWQTSGAKSPQLQLQFLASGSLPPVEQQNCSSTPGCEAKTCLQQQESLQFHICLQSKNLSAAKGNPADSHLAAKQKNPTAAGDGIRLPTYTHCSHYVACREY